MQAEEEEEKESHSICLISLYGELLETIQGPTPYLNHLTSTVAMHIEWHSGRYDESLIIEYICVSLQNHEGTLI